MTPAARTHLSKEEDAIRARSDEFVAAWDRHDTRAMSGSYAEDADLINPFGRVAKSRTAIEALFKEEHSGPLKSSRMALQSEGIRFLGTDIAIADYAFDITGARDPSGKEVRIQGHLTNILRKSGNAWEVVACRPMVPLPAPQHA